MVKCAKWFSAFSKVLKINLKFKTWTVPKSHDWTVKFERSDMESVCCQNLPEPKALRWKGTFFPDLLFFRQCESGRSKMAAYFVGSHFAYIVAIWKPISLALPGGIETAWLLSLDSSNPLCCVSLFNNVHFILSYLILMERPAMSPVRGSQDSVSNVPLKWHEGH